MTVTDTQHSAEITELIAQLGIRKALARYTRGVDRGDNPMLESAYWPDAYDDHGNFKGNPADFAVYISERFDRTKIGQHHITNVFAEVDGHTAHVESYFIAFNAQTTEAGGEHDLVTGRYLDLFEERDGEWRILKRQVVIDIARDALAGESWPRLSAFATGGRREADPSAAFFAS